MIPMTEYDELEAITDELGRLLEDLDALLAVVPALEEAKVTLESLEDDHPQTEYALGKVVDALKALPEHLKEK